MPAVTPVEPRTVHAGLAVYQFGDGDPILLMPAPHRFQRPGLRSADALIEGLTGLGRTVITFDPPGSGRSTRPARLGMEEMHGCAEESLVACGISGPIDVFGHSMAGLTTLAFTIEHPERVRRMVLVGTGSGGSAYMTAPGALWHRGHPRFARLAVLGSAHLLVRRLATERLLNNLIERESFEDKTLSRRQPVAFADWFRPAAGRADWHRVARKLDYRPRLAEIAVPVLLLCGRADPQYPAACSAELAAGIPGAELVFFEHSGHFPFIEEPDTFWSAVGAFLR